jgi:hypothetical protein
MERRSSRRAETCGKNKASFLSACSTAAQSVPEFVPGFFLWQPVKKSAF